MDGQAIRDLAIYEKQILGGCILLGVPVESGVLVSNSMDSSPLSILTA